MPSVHGICYDESQAGNCGLQCEGFLNKECDIMEEVVEVELGKLKLEQKTGEVEMDVTTSGSKFENCTSGLGVDLHTGEDKMFESPVRIEIVHMVNGRNVDGMSKEELMNCLFDIERYNKKLKYAQKKAESKSIEKEIKKNEKVYKKIVKYLDE